MLLDERRTVEGELMKSLLSCTSIRIVLLSSLLFGAIFAPRAAAAAHATPVPGSIDTTLLLDIPATSTDFSPTFGMWRQTLNSGTSVALQEHGAGEVVLLVESGRLTVRSESWPSIAKDVSADPVRYEPGDELEVGAGEAVRVWSGAPWSFRAAGQESATVLAVVLGASRPDFVPALGGAPDEVIPGLDVEPLAWTTVDEEPMAGEGRLQLHAVTIDSESGWEGRVLPEDREYRNPGLVAVVGGTIDVTPRNGGEVIVWHGTGSGRRLDKGETVRLVAGDSYYLPTQGHGAKFHNTGDAPTDLLVLRFVAPFVVIS